MSFRNILTEKVILPLSDLALGQSVSKHLKFLQESQWWTKEQLVEFQNRKLRDLINHAYNNTEYYHDLFEKLKLKPSDIKTIEDLYKIPFITKKELQDNIKNGKLIAKNIPKKNLIKNSSSGSTGEPLTYYSTKNAYSFNIAANLRGWYWMDYRVGDKFQKISNTKRSKFKKIQDKVTVNNCIFFDSSNINSIQKIVEEIINYKPKILRSYPTPLSMILKYSRENNIKLPQLQAVTTTGSILHSDLRDEIKNAFQCEVFDSYSCEGGAVAFECKTHECYHLAMEYAITELVSDLTVGQDDNLNKVTTTDLWNYAVPIIRYDTQDFVEPYILECNCGRKHQTIKKIIGRDADILKTPSGVYLSPHLVSIFFKEIVGIEKFQVRQDKLDHLEILIITGNINREEIINEISTKWKERFGNEFKLGVKIVDDIPLVGVGKHRYVIRDKKIFL